MVFFPRTKRHRARGNANSTSPITNSHSNTYGRAFHPSRYGPIRYGPIRLATVRPNVSAPSPHPLGSRRMPCYNRLRHPSNPDDPAERSSRPMSAPSHPERILVCVAWPYANGATHVGHIAGVYLPGDIFARYHRLRGNDVLMVSGSDEHGTPITVRRRPRGRRAARGRRALPRASSSRCWRAAGHQLRPYTETTTENHRAVHAGHLPAPARARATSSRDRWTRPTARRDQRFLPDRYVEGTCPHCGYAERARRPVRQLRPLARPRRS